MGSTSSKNGQQIQICDDTRIKRDQCIFKNGEKQCTQEINEHILCMKERGYALKS